MTVEKKENQYKELFKEKNYLQYLIGNTISRFGDSLDAIAFAYLVYQITASEALMAVIFGVNVIPNILLQPFTGVLVDYWSKKKVQLICNIGRALSVFFVVTMYLTNSLETYHLFIFTIINSTLESFQLPSEAALLPLILKKDLYTKGISFKTTIIKTVELVGLAFAGGLIAIIGVVGVLIIDALTFIICGILLGTLKYEEITLIEEKINVKKYFIDLKLGFSYIWSKKLVINICFFAAIINFFIAPFNALQVYYVVEVLKGELIILSAIGISLTLGMLLGSVILPAIEGKIKTTIIFIGSGILISALYVGLILATYTTNPFFVYVILIIGSLVSGIGVSGASLIIGIYFAKTVEPEYMGRVSGVLGTLTQSAVPLGAFITAFLTRFFDTRNIFIICFIAIFILFILQFFNKVIKEFDEK